MLAQSCIGIVNSVPELINVLETYEKTGQIRKYLGEQI